MGTISEQPYEPSTFDVITLWDVIEHSPHPRELLDRCRALLKPGGVLVVNYPDVGSWIARALGRRWPFLSSVHLHYFDRRTIRQLLEASGFSVEVIRPHVQRLELGYGLRRAGVVNGRLAAVGGGVSSASAIARLHVPYWLGQTFVGARRWFALLLPAAPDLAVF